MKDPFGRELPSTLTVEDNNSVTISVQVAKRSLSDYIKSRMNDTLRTNNSTQSRVNQKMLRGFEGFHGELRKLWGVVDENTREEKARHLMRDKIKNGKRQMSSERQKDMTVGQEDIIGDQTNPNLSLPQVLFSDMTQTKEMAAESDGIQSVASIKVPSESSSDRSGEIENMSRVEADIEGEAMKMAAAESYYDSAAAVVGTNRTTGSVDKESILELPVDLMTPAAMNVATSSEADVVNPSIYPSNRDTTSSIAITSSPRSNEADVVRTPTIAFPAVTDTKNSRTESLLDSMSDRLTSSANHLASTRSVVTTLRMNKLSETLAATSPAVTALLEDQLVSTTSKFATSASDIPSIDPTSLESLPASPFSGVDQTKPTETPPETAPLDTGNLESATAPRKRGRPKKYQE